MKRYFYNKVLFPILNRKIKTSGFVLTEYIKITKVLVIEQHHQVCANFKVSISHYSTNRQRQLTIWYENLRTNSSMSK